MRTILCAILFLLNLKTFSQQKSNTVSVSHYVNPELYIKAGVLCRITDKNGRPAKNGNFLSIYNKNGSSFSYSYPVANKSWRSIGPKQKVIIPVQRTASITVVPLKVKYTPVNNTSLAEKFRELSQQNAASDQVSFENAPAGLVNTRRNRELLNMPVPVKNPGKTKKSAAVKPLQKLSNKAQKEQVSARRETQPETTTGGKSSCIYTTSPAYYTFYYLKVNNELLYSDVFAVPSYTNEDEGQALLEQVWFCFVVALKSYYTEERVDQLLNDRDNDLQLGFNHLRDPFIPSATIIQTYPYTNTAELAEAELKNWLAFDKQKYPELRFVRINFNKAM